jgi:hypothetical protein
VLLKGLADWSPGISGLATSLLASGRLGPGTARSFAVTAAHRVDPASYSLLRDLVAPDQRARTEVLPVLAARTEIVRTFADPTPETR